MGEPEPWETCRVEGDNIDEVWCLTHDQHPGQCWDAWEKLIAALSARFKELEDALERCIPFLGESTEDGGIHAIVDRALASKGA